MNHNKIFHAWRKRNDLTLREVAAEVLGLAPTSIINPKHRQPHIERIAKILTSEGVICDFLHKCECGAVNVVDPKNQDDMPQACEGCGKQFTN